MKRAVSILRNKYLIASLIFLVWMVFFDRHDLATQFDYYSELKTLEKERSFYGSEIERISKTLENLETNAEEQERFARERYQMKKPDEDVYILIRETE